MHSEPLAPAELAALSELTHRVMQARIDPSVAEKLVRLGLAEKKAAGTVITPSGRMRLKIGR